MARTANLQLALALACLTFLAGCAQCGDAIICPPAAPVDFPSDAVPVVRLNGDSLLFEAPRSLRRHSHYALYKVYVYEVIGGKVVWQIDTRSKEGLNVLKMAQYDPRAPLTYGQAVEGTVLTVPAGALQAGKDYHMRGEFIGYDQPGVLSTDYTKVTFRLKRENGQLRAEQLPTRREG